MLSPGLYGQVINAALGRTRKQQAEDCFEKQIWDEACVLRGTIDALEYKFVVLGLIFLKYTFEVLKLPSISKRHQNY